MSVEKPYVIEVKSLTRTFNIGVIAVHALRGIDLTIETGEFVAIMGSSGSGKSTLMNLLGCLDVPTSGEYLLDGKSVIGLTKTERADIRNHKVGFVFQGYNLLPRTSAVENVEMPLNYDRSNRVADHRKAAIAALERVGLEDRLHHNPSQLSGGQQQRVAIARALVNRPAIVLADEPTGNLDSVASLDIIALFQQLNREGVTIILVTHEQEISRCARRVIYLRDGLVIENRVNTQPLDAAQMLANLEVPV